LIFANTRHRRPKIIDLPPALVPFELLFQVTLLGGALDDAREFYRQVVSELELIVPEYLNDRNATVADTLMATSRVYTLFQSITMDESEEQIEVPDQQEQEDEKSQAEQMLNQRETERQPQRRDARELFNAWNAESEGEFDELDGSESFSEGETPEQGLEEGEVAFNYDEWDRELVDHRVGWCRVIEKKVKRGSRDFVDDTRESYKGVVSSMRHQFQLMKPENLTRITNELDGEITIERVVDFFIDRRADDNSPSESIRNAAPPPRRRRFIPARSVVIHRAHNWPSSPSPLHASRPPHHRDRKGRAGFDERGAGSGRRCLRHQRLHLRRPSQCEILCAERFPGALFR
jgi:hypothetical protein